MEKFGEVGFCFFFPFLGLIERLAGSGNENDFLLAGHVFQSVVLLETVKCKG